ncbi:MAG: SDR family NAD(P)-dependent oxidoreductase [Candidatus Thiodiazotropha lotti]|nr:SDR family NAD(P)-dependent oxidoreductase [Candidatus Thiodiazotropha lotti]MCG7932228.1 SDR family NAD(P)-dependent oxidoreductase [Candidatus Thiodiazotropha lotti]MCG8004544.1 SDR family NAD(P)-dependent oxidoreductase [Candidatus Thiodiazotropha lotti]MCG8008901.1 SDR family NAD(P)-dependent oxidoreductase [Candidatus Thiodiazotropha lotti]MCG8021983.1 SDR family NAD(P)-dependent oxidoreductase [Candidatus Thiodiazotropha lotti]
MERFTTFKNKTALITGGTSGIGYHMVRFLSPYNKALVIARPSTRLEALQKEFPEIEVYPADLSNPLEYESVADQIIKDHKHIDVLINNAAVQYTPTYLDDDFSYDTIQPEIHLNFTAVCSLSYLLLPALLREDKQTVIANINSGLALAPKTHSAIYCATKAAMDIFSQSLSYQLENTNVRVVQAFLPLVDTPMTQGRGKGKIKPEAAAMDILLGIEQGVKIKNIGKVKLLRFLLAVAPSIAKKIMKGL